MASVGSNSHLEWVGMNTSVYGGARVAGCLVQPLTLLLAHSGVKRITNHWSLIANPWSSNP